MQGPSPRRCPGGGGGGGRPALGTPAPALPAPASPGAGERPGKPRGGGCQPPPGAGSGRKAGGHGQTAALPAGEALAAGPASDTPWPPARPPACPAPCCSPPRRHGDGDGDGEGPAHVPLRMARPGPGPPRRSAPHAARHAEGARPRLSPHTLPPQPPGP